MRRWRKMTWALILWSVLIVVWVVAGTAANECGAEADELSRNACEAGTGIGVLLVLLVGFFGFAFLSLIWFMTRPKGRTCPRCGENVRKGRLECSSCGFDFRQVGAVPSAGETPS